MAWIYVAVPIVLLAAGVPIYVILMATAMVALALSTGVDASVLQTSMFGAIDHAALLAIPLFILAGDIMGRGGIATRIVAWVVALVGAVRGSLALTTIASAELFGAMSGSSVGCVAAIGRVMYPALRDNGYDRRFAIGLVASTGAIAIVIPPSIAMIIFGIVAQESTVLLFIAGILPGLLIGIIDAVYVLGYARRKAVTLAPAARWRLIAATTKDAAWALGTPAVIFGGIYGGVFTPTEAAGIAVVYAVAVSMLVYRDIGWRELWHVTRISADLIAQIMIIVAAAGLYSWFLTISGLPQALVSFMHGLEMSAFTLLLAFNLLLLLVGSILEPPAAILILTPLFMPMVKALGIDPIHFGIVMTVNLSIGMFVPPFGLNLFAAHALFNVPLGVIYRGVLPFLVCNVIALAIISYVPWLSLVLTRVSLF